MPQIEIGLYNQGLITVIDDKDVLKPWKSEIGEACRILCFTALGDVFYYSNAEACVRFLSTQAKQTTFVDRDVRRFLNEFLIIPGVMNEVLGSQRLEAALAFPKPPLKFGQCYIAAPYECLGGSGDVETYAPGAFEIYIDLVAQTLGLSGRNLLG